MSTQTSRTLLWIVAALVSAAVLYAAAFMGSGGEPQQRSDGARRSSADEGAAPEPDRVDLPPAAAAGEMAVGDASIPTAPAPPPPPPATAAQPSPPPVQDEPAPPADILPPTRYDTPEPPPKVPPSRDTGLIFTNKPAQEEKP